MPHFSSQFHCSLLFSKLLERMTLQRIQPLIAEVVPVFQAGFL
jgi:hypothetical protein